ncbi:MAG: 23S rRNA pseudouridine(1911/1915/1917) synthase RluD [Povalibacter sp.]
MTAEQAGGRLDAVIAGALAEVSRAQVQRLIEDGHVSVGGAVATKSLRVRQGDAIEVVVPAPEPLELLPEPIPLVVLYEDSELIVIDKPAGLVVHPAAGHARGTLVNALLHHCKDLAGIGGVLRPGIVHRLDKDTSGLLVVARTLEAHTALVRALEVHEVEREYEAVCLGVMTAGGTVDAPIGRHPVDRLRQAVREDGRESVTHYRVVHRYRGHTHVRLNLETGRTHQIRVHMAHIHYPLVGDRVYGGRLLLPKGATQELIEALRAFHRQALHAARLAFAHPISGKPVEAKAPVPADMQSLLDVLKRDQKEAAASAPGAKGRAKRG